jgi:hypothetical protein
METGRKMQRMEEDEMDAYRKCYLTYVSRRTGNPRSCILLLLILPTGMAK